MSQPVDIVSGNGSIPIYQTKGSAGCDLRSNEEFILKVGKRHLFSTGIKISIPQGYVGDIRPRSGLAHKNGITVLNTPGTVDSDYRGEIKVLLINLGEEDFVVQPGMRIAQLVLLPYVRAKFVKVETLEISSRGEKGFGSTGV